MPHSTAEARTQAVNSGLLYGAHLNIWNSVGLTSVFGGAVTDAKVAKKQVLALANGAAVHVPCNNLVSAPKAAIFVQTGAKAKSITPAEAAALLQKADAGADAEKFESLLKVRGLPSVELAMELENSPPCLSVNAGSWHLELRRGQRGRGGSHVGQAVSGHSHRGDLEPENTYIIMNHSLVN